MISLSHIKKNIFGRFSRSSGLPDTALVHPAREWNIGVIVFLAVVFSGSFGAWLAYNYYGTINLGSETAVAEKLNYKRSDALAALEVYTKREDIYQALLRTVPETSTTQVEEEPLGDDAVDLIEAGLLGTDGQILPQLPDTEIVESEVPPTLDISE